MAWNQWYLYPAPSLNWQGIPETISEHTPSIQPEQHLQQFCFFHLSVGEINEALGIADDKLGNWFIL